MRLVVGSIPGAGALTVWLFEESETDNERWQVALATPFTGVTVPGTGPDVAAPTDNERWQPHSSFLGGNGPKHVWGQTGAGARIAGPRLGPVPLAGLHFDSILQPMQRFMRAQNLQMFPVEDVDATS
jgi:hypothetical protein